MTTTWQSLGLPVPTPPVAPQPAAEPAKHVLVSTGGGPWQTPQGQVVTEDVWAFLQGQAKAEGGWATG